MTGVVLAIAAVILYFVGLDNRTARISIGMEPSQVLQLLGSPDQRHVKASDKDLARWINPPAFGEPQPGAMVKACASEVWSWFYLPDHRISVVFDNQHHVIYKFTDD